jgi:hypothetical protein
VRADYSAARLSRFPDVFLDGSPNKTPGTQEDARKQSNMAAARYVLN